MYIWAIAIYVGFLILVSLSKLRGIKNQDDFMVAGRSIPTYFLVGTLICTWVGSGSLFGGAGRACREGFSALWMSAGAWAGLVIVYFLAPRVRKIAQYTVPDILEKRYNQWARLLGTIAIIIAYLTIASYQFDGGGRLLNILTGGNYKITEKSIVKLKKEKLPKNIISKISTLKDQEYKGLTNFSTALNKVISKKEISRYKGIISKNSSTALDPFYGKIITCLLVVILTMSAGMLSVVTLDIFNGILMTLGIIIAVPIVFNAAGGWEQISHNLPKTHFTIFGGPGMLAAFGLFFPTFLLLLGESGMYQKFFSAKNAKAARNAVIGMIVGVVLIESALAAVAIFGGSLYTKNPLFVGADGQFIKTATETIIIKVAATNLPAAMGIVLLCAAVAIIFSTANTFLIVPATNVTRDIYQRFINPKASQKKIVWFQRLMIPTLAILAFVISTFFESILDMALYAYTMVGAAVTPALLAAFIWRRVTVLGGVLSIAAGMIMSLAFAILNTIDIITILDWPEKYKHFLAYDYAIYPAAFASIATLIIVSLLNNPSPKEKWEPFMQQEQ